jgi:hypothetical protein
VPVSREWRDSVSINVRPDGGSVNMSFNCAWADVDDVLAEIFPPGSSTSPAATELDPYLQIYRAASVDITPLGSPPKLLNDIDTDPLDVIPRFETAHVSITFSNDQSERPADQDEADADGDPVPFLTHTWSAGTEIVESEAIEAKFAGGGPVKANTPVATVIPMIQHTIDWPRVISPPFNSIRSLLGRVNNSVMTFSTGSILPEMLLFVGTSLRKDYLSNGDKAWSLQYQFSERRVPIEFGISVDETYEYAKGDYIANVPLIRKNYSFLQTKWGGWNHFYDSVTHKSFARLYLKTPEGDLSLTWLEEGGGGSHTVTVSPLIYGMYDDRTAPYKKGDLSQLFTQA